MTRTTRLCAFAACVLGGLLLVSGPADAQVKPLKIRGQGMGQYVPLPDLPPTPYKACGTATLLGKYTTVGTFGLIEFTSDTTATFSALETVFIAADGSRLAGTFGDTENGAKQPGVVEFFPRENGTVVAVFLAELNPVPELCTGRFSRVTGGSLIMLAISAPIAPNEFDGPIFWTWEGEGTLEFRRPN